MGSYMPQGWVKNLDRDIINGLLRKFASEGTAIFEWPPFVKPQGKPEQKFSL